VTDDATPAPVPDPERSRHAADLPAAGSRRSSADVGTHRPAYKGEELDPARGPGLGCFWFQAAVLAIFLVLIPIGVNLDWPYEVLAVLLFIVLGLLLFVGQTMIFLLRLVAADRREVGRRRPLASPTPTVGELEDSLGPAPLAGEVGAVPATGLEGEGPEAAEQGTPEAAEPGTPGPPTVEPGPASVRE
jgi:hypothetical protein